MGMDYRESEDGPLLREFFETKEKLESRKRELEAAGGKVERIVSVASVRDELAERTGKYPAHQGKKEIERRLAALEKKLA